MKILVYGAGVIGSFYAALYRTGTLAAGGDCCNFYLQKGFKMGQRT